VLEPMSDRRRFDAIVREHYTKVFGYCVRTLRDRELAEEVTQVVFEQAYRGFDRFEGRASVIGWLRGIAHNRCIDAVRARRRAAGLIDQDDQVVTAFADPGPDPLEHLDHAQQLAALEDCLQRLPDETRATVLLRYRTEETFDELARRLGGRSDALYMRVARAKQALRRCLERKGWTGE
jgi:RNA polymerase sigma factor (sigma-70 family)